MKVYSIFRIQNNFRVFYNFNTNKFDKHKNKKTRDHFCTSKIKTTEIHRAINDKENLRPWGCANFCNIYATTID
jgi:hypothetical protein